MKRFRKELERLHGKSRSGYTRIDGYTQTDGESREGREDPVGMALSIGHTISRREFMEKLGHVRSSSFIWTP